MIKSMGNTPLISIHAPPRGATPARIRPRGQQHISIHAPPRGATPIPSHAREVLRFQFTPLREGRPPAPSPRRTRRSISIHAPPRGATCFGMALHSRFVFQFTPLREGRPDRPSPCSARPYFNSRPSARGDAPAAGAPPDAHDFNSRPSARGDSKRYAISANLLFNPYKSAWLNNNATQFVEIILVIFHRIIA